MAEKLRNEEIAFNKICLFFTIKLYAEWIWQGSKGEPPTPTKGEIIRHINSYDKRTEV